MNRKNWVVVPNKSRMWLFEHYWTWLTQCD